MKSLSSPSIIVHGGAGPIRDGSLAARLEGCRGAALKGWEILKAGGTALDAAEAAVVMLEDNPLFNAGTGATLNSLGEAELDAALMEGHTLRAGAVAAVKSVKNPIMLARRVLEDGRHVLLAGEGARRFARDMGLIEAAPHSAAAPERSKPDDSSHGTVGCVVCDVGGRLAAATSTGGIFNKLPGRVGDSPLIGSGTYADAHGAVSCTGHGEAVIRLVLGKTTVDLMRNGASAKQAAADAVGLLASRIGSTGGLIAIDSRGEIGFARNTTHMPVCYFREDSTAVLES